MKKITLQTQKVLKEGYAFTLEVNFDSVVEQEDNIIYYVKTDNYSVYKYDAYWYILDKTTHISYLGNKLLTKTQLKELTEVIRRINKELNNRVKGQTYYYIDSDLTIQKSVDLLSNLDKIYYNLGNYFTEEEKAKETALKLKEFWTNIKDENDTYIFRLSSNIKQINNIPYNIRGKLLDKILKICKIVDKRLIEFTIYIKDV